MNTIHTCLAALALLLIDAVPAFAADKVDAETFIGWKLYHDSCVTCHGVGGVGTKLGPDLTESLKRLSAKEFELKVLNRYLLEVPSEEAMSESRSAVRDAFIREINKSELADAAGMPMPEWKHNPIVKENINYIYRYLKARSLGIIGPGRPEIVKE